MPRWMIALALLTACAAPADDDADDTDTDAVDTDDTDADDTDADDTDATVETDLSVTLPSSWQGTFFASSSYGAEASLICDTGSTIRFAVDPEQVGLIMVIERMCNGAGGYMLDFGGFLGEADGNFLPLVDASYGLGNGPGGALDAKFTDSDEDGIYDLFTATGSSTSGTPDTPEYYVSQVTISATALED